jgi:hypothetical protein
MPPARFLVSVDGLGNMPSNRRADPRQSGKTLPDRLLCAVICGDIHTRSDSSAQAMGFFPMPESVTGNTAGRARQGAAWLGKAGIT